MREIHIRYNCDKLAACPSEPRHYGADRHPRHFSDLAIVKALNVPQYQRLPEWRRQSSDCRAELFGVGFCDECCLWRLAVRVAWLGVLTLDRLEIFDRDDRGWTIFCGARNKRCCAR